MRGDSAPTSTDTGDGARHREAAVDTEVLAVHAHLLAAQQRPEHREVLPHVRGRRDVGQAVQALDHGPVRHADAEREPPPQNAWAVAACWASASGCRG